ncbi:MAG: CinA family protein [Pelagibacterales bacterium]|jgi:nicotinamide-nucleotide amidase|nr:CinA family protein [Pelagibacterales bacterium]
MSSLEQIIASKFKELKKTLSVAESCTGGSICSRIVSNEGASTYFKGGIVCYSTESKTNILGLDAKTINDYSVVSKEVCELMAISVKNLFNSDFSISTTGNAGPEKGESNVKIGKVFISVATENNVNTYELNFDGNRKEVINNTVVRALELLKDNL